MPIESERANFQKLIQANPNFFGTIATSPLKPVKPMAANTTYEELTCISFNPATNKLEATIQVKRDTGYGGNLCQSGSQEYVRFFLDYGAGWVDVGAAAVNVHDVPATSDCAKQPVHPISYVVTLGIDPQMDLCTRPVLPNVHAILSWQWLPPAGSANVNWQPPWGNSLEKHIQIRPRFLILKDVIDAIGAQSGQAIKLAEEHELLAGHPLQQPEVPVLPLADLVKLYPVPTNQPPTVPAHRFGLTEINATLASSAQHQEIVAAKIAEWKALGLDWEATVNALAQLSGDVSYEELECLGLDENAASERLVATLIIKRPVGYSGVLCQHGSIEYVAFWADWDNTCQWTYLGTAQIPVHDIATIPPDGLHYAAILPVDLTTHRSSCELPKVARVRAVLSWNVVPSTTNPDALTYWGNRLDTHVQILPGVPVDPGNPQPIMGVLGGIPLSKIDLTTGMTTPDAFFALNGLEPDPGLHRPCPFGGRVVLQGPSFVGYKYRVRVHQVGDPGPPIDVTTTMQLVDLTGTIFTTQIADPTTHFFNYVSPQFNIDNVLAWWDTTGDALWDVTLDLANAANVILGSATHRIQLDNTAPTVEIHIDAGGDCKTFTENTTLNGHFVARDANFGSYSLGTSPFPGSVVPSNGTVQTAPTPGDTWSLNTTGMQPCGYVITVVAVDRAIVNSASVGHYSPASAGFCVIAPTP
jgi:hypothetical protein